MFPFCYAALSLLLVIAIERFGGTQAKSHLIALIGTSRNGIRRLLTCSSVRVLLLDSLH